MNSAQRSLKIVSILIILISFLNKPSLIYAVPDDAPAPITASSITSYLFSANEGDSLSRIVRRALQLRAVADRPIAMYCENVISGLLGGGYIDLQQKVVVSYAQIDSCALKAKGLDADERAAWQAYADTADFNLNDLNPVNNSSNVVPADSSYTNSPSQMENGVSPQNPDVRQTPKPIAAPKNPLSPIRREAGSLKPTNAWWYVIAAILLLLFIRNDLVAKRRSGR